MEKYRQCACGGLYGPCGHRMPTLRRDAANTLRSTASADPKFSGIFWGVIAVMVVLGWIVSGLSKIPHQAWPVIGIGAGVVASIIVLAVILNRMTDPDRKKKVKVDSR